MICMTTIDTDKLIALAVSPIPSLAHGARLRGLPGIFSFQTNTLFLTQVLQALSQKVIQPMGQSSIQTARKRSALESLDVFQVLNTQDSHSGEVDLFECLPRETLDVCMGMFLALGKTLNHMIGRIASRLPVREDQSVLVIGIHSDDVTHDLQGGASFFNEYLNKELPLTPPHAHSLAHGPSISQEVVQVARTVERHAQAWCARANETQRIIEVLAHKRLQSHEVRIQRRRPPAYPGFAVPIGMCRSASFLGLLGQGLCQAGRDAKMVPSPVHRFQIRKICCEVLSLPEQIHKILCDVVALMQKVTNRARLPIIEIVQENTRGAAHDGAFSVGFPHGNACFAFWSRVNSLRSNRSSTSYCFFPLCAAMSRSICWAFGVVFIVICGVFISVILHCMRLSVNLRTEKYQADTHLVGTLIDSDKILILQASQNLVAIITLL